MNKKEHMISDIDKMIDIICKDFNRAKQGLKELKQFYHTDPDINEERLFLLFGEILELSRHISRLADNPILYQSDQTIIGKAFKDDPQE